LISGLPHTHLNVLLNTYYVLFSTQCQMLSIKLNGFSTWMGRYPLPEQ